MSSVAQSSSDSNEKRRDPLAWLRPKYYTINWFSLPAKVRSVVIDQMDPQTRCTFASSSSACYKEAIRSENYVYGIEINETTHQCFHFNIWHTEKHPSYRLTFSNCGDQTSVKYQTLQQQASVRFSTKSKQSKPAEKYKAIACKWERKENGASPDVALRYLKQFLNKFERNLKFFTTDVVKFPFEKFDLLNAQKLKKIDMAIQKQGDDLIWLDFVNVEMLSTVTDVIRLYDAPLELDEIVQLKADKIFLLNDLKLSSKDINEYLKLWVAGKLHPNLEKFHMKLTRYTVMEWEPLTMDLDVFDWRENMMLTTKFKLKSVAGEIASIHFNDSNFGMVIEDEIIEVEAVKSKKVNLKRKKSFLNFL